MGALAEAKAEWKHFREDPPGERFCNHRIRMRDKPRHHSLIASGIGLVLIAVGIVLLFVPGPGSPLILFGVGLFASHSKRLAALLDRGEVKVRRLAHRTKRKWRAMSGSSRLGVILGIAAIGAAFFLFTWRYVVSAYLLG